MEEVLKFNSNDIKNMDPRERTEIAVKLISPFVAEGDIVENLSLITALIMTVSDTYEDRHYIFKTIVQEISRLTVEQYESFRTTVNEMTENMEEKEN